MPRGSNRKKTTEQELDSVGGTATMTETVPTEFPGPDEPQDQPSQPEARRGQFRSWVVDTRRGYTGMTDEENHYLVLQFAEKPQPDILAALKGAKFRFNPDHCGLKNVWVRRNDFEGRVQVESIEKLLRELVPVPESLER